MALDKVQKISDEASGDPGIASSRSFKCAMVDRFTRKNTASCGIAIEFLPAGAIGKLIEWAKQMFGYRVEVVGRKEQHLFRVLPKRWIVERTFAWLNWSRRLSKDYERRSDSAETMIHIAFAHQLLRRRVA